LFIKTLTLSLICLLAITACKNGDPAQQRQQQAKISTGDIVIGVVWPWRSRWHNFGKGIDLATKQINKAGGINGRKLKLIRKNDEGSINKGSTIAHEFANNPKMVAVIGHINSYISIPASKVYQDAGLLMLTPGSSSTLLTENGHHLIFRLAPNNQQIVERLVSYAHKQGYKRIIIYYARNEYGRNLANQFEQDAVSKGITIVDRKSYARQNGLYVQTLKYWHEFYHFDALFIAGALPETAHIIKQLRQLGITTPLFSADAVDDSELITIAGSAAEKVLFISVFDPNSTAPVVKQFRNAYWQAYHQQPDTPAALGYDAIKLLATAIRHAKSTQPSHIAKALSNLRNWPGVTGIIEFNRKGDIINRQLFKKRVKHGQFVIEP